MAMQVTGGELRLAVCLMPFGPLAIAAATGDEFTCEAWLDDAVGISRWRGRRTPVKPSCQVRRETSSQAPAHETAGAGTDADLPSHLLRISFCDDECRPPVHAWGGETRCAAGTPAPTAAAQEQAAPIAEADMRADAFEGVV
ncbi:hypothetical protein ACFVAF_29625 [Streptomyces sp. NPDC057596]|uniref:hypothetical protein n=1 Tax=Streptomyces sp. NPDC057596 TaxID=3346178 RepID=UPI0036CB02BF